MDDYRPTDFHETEEELEFRLLLEQVKAKLLVGDTGIFRSPYDQYRDRVGQHFEIIRVITRPESDVDLENLPMYVIRFDDGDEIHAWPEEVE